MEENKEMHFTKYGDKTHNLIRASMATTAVTPKGQKQQNQ
jgi:hypothetical protein